MLSDVRAPIVGDLTLRDFTERLTGRGLGVRLGPFDASLRSDVRAIFAPLRRLYRDYPLLEGERVFHFHANLSRGRSFPRLDQRVVRFTVDGRSPHADLPAYQAMAVLEWGINLVIALRTHSFLLLHSAAVERRDGVMLMPAVPGHGKTTLCAGLIHRGWRLFSDEFGLIRPGGTEAIPMPRPLPLKNQSIAVIRQFAADAEIGTPIPNTRKGTVAHLKAPAASVRDAHRSAPVRWIVFPRWQAGADLVIEEIPKADAFMAIAINAFNYELLGEVAFMTVRSVVDAARCFELVYSDLDQATAALSELADEDASG